MSERFNLASPWLNYARKINALFKDDPEVKVDYDNDAPAVMLYVNSNEKAEALSILLPMEKEFGNVTLQIKVIPANTSPKTRLEVFSTAFKGNPAVVSIEKVAAYDQELGFIIFEPKVVQYPTDDIGDYFGIESTLYEDVARDIFEKTENVFFSTDIAVDTNKFNAGFAAPLGEWP